MIRLDQNAIIGAIEKFFESAVVSELVFSRVIRVTLPVLLRLTAKRPPIAVCVRATQFCVISRDQFIGDSYEVAADILATQAVHILQAKMDCVRIRRPIGELRRNAAKQVERRLVVEIADNPL